jgi:hypothetical protein
VGSQHLSHLPLSQKLNAAVLIFVKERKSQTRTVKMA